MIKLFRGNWHFWLFLLVFLVYGNTLFNSYGFDDSLVTTPENELVKKGVSGIPEIFTSYYIDWENKKADYRPLVKLTYALEYEAFGFKPGISHFINVLLFGLTAIFLFHLLCFFFDERLRLFLFLAVCLFCIHPINTEVVASLKGRDELLSLMFTIFSFHYIVRFYKTESAITMLIALVLYVLSMMSKMSSITWVPILLVGLHYYNGLSRLKTLKLGAGLVILTMMYYVSVFMLFDDWKRPFHFIETPFHFLPTDEKIASIIAAAGYYLKLLVWPHPMCCYYGFDEIPSANWADLRVYGSVLGYLILATLALHQIPRKGLAGLGAIIILADVALFLNVQFPYTGIIADRVLYGSSLGVSLIVVAVVMLIAKKKGADASAADAVSKQRLFIPIIIIGVIGAVMTVNRNFDWRDNLSLISNDAETCDRSAKIHQLHGDYIRQSYFLDSTLNKSELAHASIAAYQKSIDIHNGYPPAWIGIGNVLYFDLNKPRKAIPYYERALQLDSVFKYARYDLIEAYFEIGQPNLAVSHLTYLLRSKPNDEFLMNKLVNAFFLSGNFESAQRENERFLRTHSSSDWAIINQGNLFLAKGDTIGALGYFDRALELNSSNLGFQQYVTSLRGKLGSD
ncbi:MAG TPA: hypothetical protein DCR04_10865 [Flavobacteriales bacterium]|nr:hypothetical protein [Flavobacteriales bacterium]